MSYNFTRTEILDPRREWIRQNLPSGREGFTFEDIDGIASTFPNNGVIRPRRRLFIEHKWNNTELDVSQQILFRSLDAALRKGDPTYDGFYLVTWPGRERGDGDDVYEIDFTRQPLVNGQRVSWDDLKRFYLGELDVKPLFR